ncbi:MotA/TolQ/ExbB proton channel family protein [Enterovibrio calviensis]|uniref:MotA/TolQ/ExbB proton channel family protein n=1 Tax=Enterovibrio calviensis TaxID=91359 RepID=UPI0004892C21|nr:MotA/TolQ/ExbB proton channel family protein [Enterovibrio calviensis]
MNMKRVLPALFIFMSLLVAPVHADLVSDTQAAHAADKSHNSERESAFEEQETALQRQLEALKQQQKTLESDIERLSDDFAANENTLADLEQTLLLETGSLGEVFGVVRQVAKEIQQERDGLPVTASQPMFEQELAAIADADALPSLSDLTAMYLGIMNDLSASSQIGSLKLNVRDANGVMNQKEVQHVGNIALVGQNGYLEWDGKRQQANLSPFQPEGGLTTKALEQDVAGDLVVIDPTGSAVLNQLAATPTLAQRFEQAGLVGKVIAALLVIGVGIVCVRGFVLYRTGLMIRRQMNTPEAPGDNPLGRVLNVYRLEPNRSLDALELRLMEAIMDEQQGFEKGLSMLKLLAALAPMLGLLGTVTGMIETFQIITQFGNSDPSVMAGGISMALVTTVMGLVAAIPLLLAHNLLTTQAEMLRGTLEKVGVSLVAQQSELPMKPTVLGLSA